MTWHETADHTGKAPEHKAVARKGKLKDTLRTPMAPVGTATLLEEARKYKAVDEFLNSQISKENGLLDSHVAPSSDTAPVEYKIWNAGDFSLVEVANGKHRQPSDYFDHKTGAKTYGYDTLAGHQSLTAIDNIIRAEKNGIHDRTITAYRAVPKNLKIDELQNGDWITFSENYAKKHGDNRFDGEYKIIKQEVKPKDVWWDGNDINEWGYDTGTKTGKTRKTLLAKEKELIKIWDEAHSEDAGTPRLYRGDKTPIPLSQQDPLAVFNPITTESVSAFTSTPGLYFTTSKENALHYGSHLTTVRLKPNARIRETLIPKPLVLKILKSHPNLGTALSNWSENRREALEMLLESIMDETDPVERLKAIWGDAQFSNEDFVLAMVKAGIDGIKVPKDPYFHYVIYNRQVIEEII